MSITTEAQRNKLMHLENSLIMYRVYNMEQLFTEQQVAAYKIYSKMQNAPSVQHIVTNTLLKLCTIKEKYHTLQ